MNRNKPGFRAGRDDAAVQENIELLTGQRGGGLDRAVTLRDLSQLGLANLQLTSSGLAIPKSVSKSGDDKAIVQMPHAPVNFNVTGGFGAILLEWDKPTFTGYAHTEIWRSTTDVLSEAVLIATTPATVFGDIVDPGSSYYYWIRFINLKNIAGPYHNTDGVLGQTSQDISSVIDDIGTQLADSVLVQGLNSGLDDISTTVQQHSSTISSIDENGSVAHKAMWNTKAQADDIQAGIGILADSEGKSQVAVAASQFFVYDPNNADPDSSITPLFAIDEGNVIIPSALIQTATIQILNAQTITADEVRAGITMTAPEIIGGKIRIGTNFIVDEKGYMKTINGEFSGYMYGSTIEGTTIRSSVITGGAIQASYIAADVKMLVLSYYNQAAYGSMSVEYLENVLKVTPYMAFNTGVASSSNAAAGSWCYTGIRSYNYSTKSNYVRYTRKYITPSMSCDSVKGDTAFGYQSSSIIYPVPKYSGAYCKLYLLINGVTTTVQSGRLYNGQSQTISGFKFTCHTSLTYSYDTFNSGGPPQYTGYTHTHYWFTVEATGTALGYHGNSLLGVKMSIYTYGNAQTNYSKTSMSDTANNATTPTNAGPN